MRADKGTGGYEEQKSYPEEKEKKHCGPPFTSPSILDRRNQLQFHKSGIDTALALIFKDIDIYLPPCYYASNTNVIHI